MRLNLSSQIVLNKVPVEFYKPKTTVEYSEISRMEKIHTDIFASVSEGCSHIADCIEKGIKAAQHEGKYYVMALGTGLSVNPVYDELVSRYEKKKLSFRNVVVFNAYEYYPLRKDSSIRSINQLKEHFLDHVDIAEQNIFTLDGNIAQEAVQDTCRLYEQRIKLLSSASAAWVISQPTNRVQVSSRSPVSSSSATCHARRWKTASRPRSRFLHVHSLWVLALS